MISKLKELIKLLPLLIFAVLYIYSNLTGKETILDELTRVEQAQTESADIEVLDIAEKTKTLEETKSESLAELKMLKFLSEEELADFAEQINSEHNADDVEITLAEAKDKNDAEISRVYANSDNFQKATVIEAVDGDTVRVNIDGKIYKLRMIGVDTPETKHVRKGVQFYGIEASNFTKEQLLGAKVYLEKDVSETDKFDRILRYIWLMPPQDPDNPTYEELKNQSYNGILVRDGYANASTFPPDVKYKEWFAQMAKEAREANLGLWNKTERKVWEAANGKTENNEENNEENNADDEEQSKWIQTTETVTKGGTTYEVDTTQGPVKGNTKTKKYHTIGSPDYNNISVKNVTWFNTEEEAQAEGYVPTNK